MYGFFWILNRYDKLRISLGHEALGLDHAAMGEGNLAGLLSDGGPSIKTTAAGLRPTSINGGMMHTSDNGMQRQVSGALDHAPNPR
jgi:hypothetical protein